MSLHEHHRAPPEPEPPQPQRPPDAVPVPPIPLTAIGNAALARLLTGDGAALTRAIPVLARQGHNEAAVDPDTAAYEASMDEQRKVLSKPLKKERFIPSTGQGRFDAQYVPADRKLLITVRVGFVFIDSQRKDVDWTDPARPTMKDVRDPWTKAQIAKFKGDFFQQTSRKWSGAHTFFCHRDWWEGLSATTEVRFVEAPENASAADGPHFTAQIFKTGDLDVPYVRGGAAKFRDIDTERVKSGRTTSEHEAGHMLGLGDEYHDADDEPGQKAWHSGLVEREFGHEVIKGKADAESIMAGGSKVLPEHGVTLLEALRAIVPEATWGHEAKPPKRVPPPRPGATAPPAGAPAQPGDSGGGVPGVPSPPGNDLLPPGLRSEGS